MGKCLDCVYHDVYFDQCNDGEIFQDGCACELRHIEHHESCEDYTPDVVDCPHYATERGLEHE